MERAHRRCAIRVVFVADSVGRGRQAGQRDRFGGFDEAAGAVFRYRQIGPNS